MHHLHLGIAFLALSMMLGCTCAAAAACPAASDDPSGCGVSVDVGSASGKAGEQVSIAVTLHTAGIDVAGVQNDLSFTPGATPLVGCVVNPELHKDFSAIKVSVAGLRAIIAGDNIDPIPDGSVLYTCTFTILDVTLASYRLINSRVIAASPSGERLDPAAGDGAITVVGPRPPSTPTATPPPPGPLLTLTDAVAAPGDQVTIAAQLSTAGQPIAGIQNDIAYSTQAPIAAKADGTPDCIVNPDIHKETTAFKFTLAGLRAVVLSVENVDPIADGAVLYKCRVDVSPQATHSSYSLDVSNVIFSDPLGQRVPDVGGVGGTIFVQGPTPTETPVRPAVIVNSVQGNAGDQVILAVSLQTGGEAIAGVQDDIIFDAVHTPFATKLGGKADCAGNPAINKDATAFNFLPDGCAGAECQMLRALVLSYENTDAIADGAVLYTCKITIPPDAENATYPLDVTNVVMSSPRGERIPDVRSESGVVLIGGGSHVDHKPVPGVPGVPPVLPGENVAPGRPVATATATATAVAARAADGAAVDEMDGGCQVGARGGRGGALLMMLGLGLVAARRRV